MITAARRAIKLWSALTAAAKESTGSVAASAKFRAHGRELQVEKVKQGEAGNHLFAFKVGRVVEVSEVKEEGLVVDTGAALHILGDIAKFKDFDEGL